MWSSEICLVVDIEFFRIQVPQISTHIFLKAAASAFNWQELLLVNVKYQKSMLKMLLLQSQETLKG